MTIATCLSIKRSYPLKLGCNIAASLPNITAVTHRAYTLPILYFCRWEHQVQSNQMRLQHFQHLRLRLPVFPSEPTASPRKSAAHAQTQRNYVIHALWTEVCRAKFLWFAPTRQGDAHRQLMCNLLTWLFAGEEHAYCQALIEAHKACLRVEGFKVRCW